MQRLSIAERLIVVAVAPLLAVLAAYWLGAMQPWPLLGAYAGAGRLRFWAR